MGKNVGFRATDGGYESRWLSDFAGWLWSHHCEMTIVWFEQTCGRSGCRTFISLADALALLSCSPKQLPTSAVTFVSFQESCFVKKIPVSYCECIQKLGHNIQTEFSGSFYVCFQMLFSRKTTMDFEFVNYQVVSSQEVSNTFRLEGVLTKTVPKFNQTQTKHQASAPPCATSARTTWPWTKPCPRGRCGKLAVSATRLTVVWIEKNNKIHGKLENCHGFTGKS